MKKLIFSAVVILALTSCSKGWSKKDKDEFIKSCEDRISNYMNEDAASNYCSCMQEKIEEKYPISKDAKKIRQSEAKEMAKDCFR